MKKVLSVLLAVCILFMLCSCSGGSKKEVDLQEKPLAEDITPDKELPPADPFGSVQGKWNYAYAVADGKHFRSGMDIFTSDFTLEIVGSEAFIESPALSYTAEPAELEYVDGRIKIMDRDVDTDGYIMKLYPNDAQYILFFNADTDAEIISSRIHEFFTNLWSNHYEEAMKYVDKTTSLAEEAKSVAMINRDGYPDMEASHIMGLTIEGDVAIADIQILGLGVSASSDSDESVRSYDYIDAVVTLNYVDGEWLIAAVKD